MYEITSAKADNNKTTKRSDVTIKHSLNKGKDSSSCGSCSVCKSLHSPRISSQSVSSILSYAKSMGKESCAASFMQKNYGNRFTANMLSQPSIQKKCSCGGSCTKCKGEEEAEKVSMGIMKMSKPSAISYQPPANNDEKSQISEIMSNKGSGQGLDENTRSFMGERFGYDFSHVRLHTDSYAARKSNELNAMAFTIGRDIFFNAGRYNASIIDGKRLLAHELTHVIQQKDKKPQSAKIQRSVVVNPNTAAADDILSQFRFLCTDVNFDRSGQTITVDQSSNASKSCECLTDVVGDTSRTYTINVRDVVGSTEVETLYDGTTAGVPMPDFFPNTAIGTNPDITLPSAGSNPEFGILLTSGNAFWRPRWRVLVHELCGHARMIQSGGGKGCRPGHDVTIDTENDIAAEHGGPARGHFTDRRQGESFHNTVGDRSRIVFWLCNGLHYEGP